MTPRRFSEENYERLFAENSAHEQRLAEQGVGIQDMGVMRLQLETLKDMLIEGDADAEIEYRVRYQEHVTHALDAADDVVKQRAQPKLEVPRLLRPQ